MTKFEQAAYNDINRIISLNPSSIPITKLDLQFERFLLEYYSSLSTDFDNANLKQTSDIIEDYKIFKKTTLKTKMELAYRHKLSILRRRRLQQKQFEVERISEYSDEETHTFDAEPEFFAFLQQQTENSPINKLNKLSGVEKKVGLAHSKTQRIGLDLNFSPPPLKINSP
jgi:hypothetical protein